MGARARCETRVLTWILMPVILLFVTGCGKRDVPSKFQFDKINQQTDKSIIVGQVPSHSVIELIERRQDFTKLLSRALGRDVQLRIADSYSDIIDGMKREAYDLAFLGPLAYVEAVDEKNAPYKPLVRPQRYGNPYYRSIIFTHKNSGIDDLSDLRGQSIAFVDPDSTSGYLFPRAHIMANAGFDPMAEMTTEFLGSHDEVVKRVNDGSFDAGATWDDARGTVLEENLDKQLPIIGRTRPIPAEPIVIRTDLSSELKRKMTVFFMDMHKNYPDVLKTLGENIDRYVEAKDGHYNDVRAVLKTLDGAPTP